MNTIQSSYLLGQCMIDPSLNTVSGPLGTVRLQPRIVEVLQRLAETPHELVSREELLEVGWDDGYHVSDEALTKAISLLRKAFSECGESTNLVRTIPKRGYMLSTIPVSAPSESRPVSVKPVRPALLPEPALPQARRSGFDGQARPWFAAAVLMVASFWMGGLMLEGHVASSDPVPMSVRVSKRLPGADAGDRPLIPAGFQVLSDSSWTSSDQPGKRMRRISMGMP